VALAAVQSRFQETSQVNVDQEMSTLIELQTAYAANARIISTVKEMMDVLMRV
jgi:flagellar hook-associated protein 1 FlgK